MNVQQFVTKWTANQNIEKAAAQEQFIDLCHLFNHPTPNDDPTGENMAFEKGVVKLGGKSGQGWADVWKRDFFAWENKTPGKNLDDAYSQLKRYHGSLDNVPLLVVSDLKTWRIYTHFTNAPVVQHDLSLKTLLEDPHQLQLFKRVFFDADSFKPKQQTQVITEKVAGKLTEVAQSMGERYHPENVARFLDRVVFCLFAEDVELLPPHCFGDLCTRFHATPEKWVEKVTLLWNAMQTGGSYGSDDIFHFNGGVFRDIEVLLPTSKELEVVRTVAADDWRNVDASIFGTLFERGLNPDKRAQLGAHYTSRADIEDLLRPVLMAPLLAEWDALRLRLETDYQRSTQHDGVARDLEVWSDKLASLRVFDPACGSGNFLYIALQQLKDLEALAQNWADVHGLNVQFKGVSPSQCYGLELDVYAHDLAQTTLQIGYLQWFDRNARDYPPEPLLASLSHIERRDAVLDSSDPQNPKEAAWPTCDVIVGNPPFLGGKLLRRELGDEYVEALFSVYTGRVSAEADLCCYWFEKARDAIAIGAAKRAGLLATQGIRGGANREVLKRIKGSGDIFFAVSDREWTLNGAAVHVSLIGFDGGQETTRILDGEPVEAIHPDLTGTLDFTAAKPLSENRGIAFMGNTKGGSFDIDLQEAQILFGAANPHSKPNSDVLLPWVNGADVTGRRREMFIVDFGTTMTEAETELYELPLALLKERVLPERLNNRREKYKTFWWRHVESRPGMLAALRPLTRFLVTPTTTKHRLFVWLTLPTVPDHALIAFARDDDYFFGVLHSRVHELWARRMGTQLRERESGFRYTPETCFATFPFPQPSDAQRETITKCARELNERRENWLFPAEWLREEKVEFRASQHGPWMARVQNPDEHGDGVAAWTRRVPRDKTMMVTTNKFLPGAKGVAGAWHPVTDKVETALSRRTLTNLYNERPSWLARSHAALDAAVLNAYSWPESLPDEDILARLLALNAQRAETV